MRNSLETRIGLFVALTALAAVFILEVVGGARFTRGYHVYALFDNVQELKVGDRVKMAGVEIGRVESIKIENARVKVTMKIRRDAGVRTDSIATVKFTGLLGQNFVSLDFGSAGAELATNGTYLGSTEQPDLSVIMSKLDKVATGVENLTRSFSGDKIDNLLGPLISFVDANRIPLTKTISNMQVISEQVAAGNGTVGKLINDDALYNSALTTISNMQGAGDDVRLVLADARTALGHINKGEGTAGKLVTDDTLYREATASMTNLKEILQKINQGQGSVGKLVNDQEFYRNAKLTLQKLDKATEGLEDQGPLSVLGIAVNTLF